MKIAKITLAVFVSFLVNAVSFAGELTVTGSAKATYSLRGSDSITAQSNGGKGIGIANEFSLSASGETDNGIAWAYAQDIDGSTVQDDAKLTLSNDSFGTFGIFVSEGGLSAKYGWNVTAYGPGSDYGYTSNTAATVTHKTGASVAGFTYGDDIGGYNNFQYHTPAGLLPFETSVKVAYAPNLGANANSSSNAAGTVDAGDDGMNAVQYKVTTAPIDGLEINVSYMEKDNGASYKQEYQAGGASAKYAIGSFEVGVGRFLVAPATPLNSSAIHTKDYENTAIALAFNVNDALSVSYSREDSEAHKETVTVATRADAKSSVEAQITAIQAAYTMGGMTVSVASKDIENMDYTKNLDAKETVIAVSLAF